jgi:hypothetical protein
MSVRKARKPRTPPAAALVRRAQIGELLADESLTLAEIGRRTGVSTERVRQIRELYFPATKARTWHPRPRPFVYPHQRFRREVVRLLVAAGSLYCGCCRQVKDCSEFAAAAVECGHGRCHACLAAYQRRYSAEHPEYVRRSVELNRQRIRERRAACAV